MGLRHGAWRGAAWRRRVRMDHQDPFAGGLAPSHAPFTAPTSQRFGPYLGMTRMERCVCNHGAGGRATLTLATIQVGASRAQWPFPPLSRARPAAVHQREAPVERV